MLRVAAMLAFTFVGGRYYVVYIRAWGADLPLANQEIKVGGSKAVVNSIERENSYRFWGYNSYV